MRTPILLFLTLTALGPVALGQHEEHGNAYSGPEEGLGRVHMDTSCSPAVAAEFNRALALLHNFWYVRALERFTQVAKKRSPVCHGVLGCGDDLQPSLLGSAIARR